MTRTLIILAVTILPFVLLGMFYPNCFDCPETKRQIEDFWKGREKCED